MKFYTLNEKDYIIGVDDLLVSPLLISEYENSSSKIDLLINIYKSSELHNIKFALYQTRQLIENQPDLFKNKNFDEEIFTKLRIILNTCFDLLKTSIIPQIQYESSLIIYNFTNLNSCFDNLIIDSNLDILLNIFLFHNNEFILLNIISIFKNFTLEDDQNMRNFIRKSSINKIFFSYITKSNFQQYETHIELIQILKNLVRYDKLENQELIKIPEILINFFVISLKIDEGDFYLIEIVKSIILIIEKYSDLIVIFFQKNLLNLILSSLKKYQIYSIKIYRLIFSLLGNVMLGNEEICENVFKSSIIDLTEKILCEILENKQNDIFKISKDISFFIRNSSAESNGFHIIFLNHPKIITYLFDIIDHFKNNELILNTIYSIIYSISTYEEDSPYNFFINQTNMLKFLNHILEINDYNEIIYGCLELLYMLYKKKEYWMKIDFYDFRNKISVFHITKNSLISNISKEILDLIKE